MMIYFYFIIYGIIKAHKFLDFYGYFFLKAIHLMLGIMYPVSFVANPFLLHTILVKLMILYVCS